MVYIRKLWPFLLIMLLLAGCDSRALMIQLQQQLNTAQRQELIENRQPGNQLLVVSRDGNLYTMDPDGRNKLALTQDASPNHQYLQPTWSPSAEQIAWVETKSSPGTVVSVLHTSRFNGQNDTTWDVPFAPFYMYWSPNGEQLAYLSNWMDGNRPSMALRLVDVLGDPASEESIKTLARGQPFYFSWSPDSQQLLTHIGNERLEVQSIDGERAVLVDESGAFSAPGWSANQEQLFYAINENNAQLLVGANADGEILYEVTDYENRITFALSPDSQQLAYVPTDASVGMAALGPLYTMDLESQATREVTDDLVLAFFWSPDSQKIAYLDVELNSSGR